MAAFIVEKPFVLNGANMRPMLDSVRAGENFSGAYSKERGRITMLAHPQRGDQADPSGTLSLEYRPNISRMIARVQDPRSAAGAVYSLKDALKENGYDHGELHARGPEGVVFAYDDDYTPGQHQLPFELTKTTVKGFASVLLSQAHARQRISCLSHEVVMPQVGISGLGFVLDPSRLDKAMHIHDAENKPDEAVTAGKITGRMLFLELDVEGSDYFDKVQVRGAQIMFDVLRASPDGRTTRHEEELMIGSSMATQLNGLFPCLFTTKDLSFSDIPGHYRFMLRLFRNTRQDRR